MVPWGSCRSGMMSVLGVGYVQAARNLHTACMENKTPNKQEQRSAATREKLLAAARQLFAQRGYAEVGTEEVVRAAGVTRGALYHQFRGGKEELFEAVFEWVEQETTQRIADGAFGSGATDPRG